MRWLITNKSRRRCRYLNILFLSIEALSDMECNAMYPDLLRCFRDNGHRVTVVCQREKRYTLPSGKFPAGKLPAGKLPTGIGEEAGIPVLRVRTGNITKTNPIEKGISMLRIGHQFKRAIKKYLKGMHYDLILYTSPPVTIATTIKFVKKKYHAIAYLMLKDIFPQNALDLGLLKRSGWKAIALKYFIYKEKQLYLNSDCIGCMSSANAVYLLVHNPYLVNHRIEICPNTINPKEVTVTDKASLREQYALPMDKIIFICGGNFGKPQGVDFLLRILEANKERTDRYFVICGAGTDFDTIRTYSLNNSTNLKVIDYLGQEAFGNLLSACDVGLLFLDHRFTIPNYPSRLLDYMNYGLPVLAATDRATDIRLTIYGGDFGWWCESNDVLEYLRVMDEICNKLKEIPEKAENSRRYLEEHYTTQTAYEKILGSYAALKDVSVQELFLQEAILQEAILQETAGQDTRQL
jgi:glycosyltransferase involved in cell wall biosynthesis